MFGASRERLALPPAAQCEEGALGQRPFTPPSIRFPRHPGIALCYGDVSPIYRTRFSVSLTEAILICAQVILVPATQRRTVLLVGPQVRQLPRRADERLALRGAECILLHTRSDAVGVRHSLVCVSMGELKDTSICTQKPTLNTHAPVEHSTAAADMERESRRDTRRNLRSTHWDLLLLRSRLVRQPYLSSFFGEIDMFALLAITSSRRAPYPQGISSYP